MPDCQAIASQRPQNLDEALVCMQKAMDFYHAHNDYRAVFLRAYYITTVEVYAAVHQLGDYQKQIFFDPQWINALVGKFAALYFQSLTTFERDPNVEPARNAVSFLATAEEREIDLVHDRLNWESLKVAKVLYNDTIWNRVLRLVGRAVRKKTFGRIELEGIGSALLAKLTTRAVPSPFQGPPGSGPTGGNVR